MLPCEKRACPANRNFALFSRDPDKQDEIFSYDSVPVSKKLINNINDISIKSRKKNALNLKMKRKS